jgi:predicted metal-dependent phosphotriesterase family hydrolase
VLSTDLGQVGNPVHTDGLGSFVQRLLAAGFTQADIDTMTKRNPARILAIDR